MYNVTMNKGNEYIESTTRLNNDSMENALNIADNLGLKIKQHVWNRAIKCYEITTKDNIQFLGSFKSFKKLYEFLINVKKVEKIVD